MKIKFTLLAVLIAGCFSAFAQQPPNSSFSDWTGAAPANWETYGSVVKETVDTMEEGGAIAAKLTTLDDEILGPVGSIIALGGLNSQTSLSNGVPFTYRPDNIFYGYKYTTSGNDGFYVNIKLTKAAVDLCGHTPPAPGGGIFGTGASKNIGAWRLSQIPMALYYYAGTETPDTLRLTYNSSSTTQATAPVVGSVLLVDYILFQYNTLPTALEEVANRLSLNIYPNPTSDMVTIQSTEDMSGMRTVIVDMTGAIVAAKTMVGGTTNSISLGNMATGNYICHIADKSGNILKTSQISVVK